GILHKGRLVVLPVKQHEYTVRTESGSLYIKFTDGMAFCRSLSDGPQQPAKALLFARSGTDARIVQDNGGELQVQVQPAWGLYPLYVTGDVPTPGPHPGGLTFAKGSFRIGTAVKTVTPA